MPISYPEYVSNQARDIVLKHGDLVAAAIVSRADLSEDVKLSDAVDEGARSSLSVVDAVFVLEGTHSPERDKGIYDSDGSPTEALVSQAEWTLLADVRRQVETVIEGLRDDFEATLKDGEDPDERAKEAQAAVADYRAANEVAPIAEGSAEERRALSEWLSLGTNLSRGGYPLGGAYIDARCGLGLGTVDLDYVTLDNDLGVRLPHMRGKARGEVAAYLDRINGEDEALDVEQVASKLAELAESGATLQDYQSLARRAAAAVAGAAPRP